MLVSVIIPTYNPGDYIYDCLNQLSQQSVGIDSFEAVVVLNGEKEPYFSNIKSYLSNKKFNFKLLYTEEKGVSNARNIGLDYIKSKDFEYVIFLDDDDKLSSNFIEGCLKIAIPNAVIASNSKGFINNSDTKFSEDYISRCFKKNINLNFNIFGFRCFLSNAWGKLIPLNIIGNMKYNKKFSIGEDALFMFTISNKINKIILTDSDVIYYRRIRPSSASRKERSKSYKLKNNFKLIKAYCHLFLKNPFKYNLPLLISRIVATLIK